MSTRSCSSTTGGARAVEVLPAGRRPVPGVERTALVLRELAIDGESVDWWQLGARHVRYDGVLGASSVLARHLRDAAPPIRPSPADRGSSVP
jgi:hypothetical protein